MSCIKKVRFAVLTGLLVSLQATALAAEKPKLVLVLMVDQFRHDYLTRYRGDYTGGLQKLLTQGGVFTNASLDHFPTITAVGHSTILTGAIPSMSGIIANEWWDRESGKAVTSVSDENVTLLGGSPGQGASPRRLLVDTVGDELKIASKGASRVIGISFKDRSAILPAGHMANGAFWYDDKTGHFVSSTFYFDSLPAWVKAFNDSKPHRKFLGVKWLSHTLPDDLAKMHDAIEASPFGNDILEELAERAIEAEQLGQRGVTDLLAMSFSSNDHVGHTFGPESPESLELSKRTDFVLEKLFSYLDARVGLTNVLVVLSADHGVAPVPEMNSARKMPGGRLPAGIVQRTIQAGLTAKYGEGKWIVSPAEHSVVLNDALIREKKLEPAEVNRTAADLAFTIPHVFRVYTRDQLMKGQVERDLVARRVLNGFHTRRGADVYTLLEPYWMFAQHGTTHGTAFVYDAHIPLIFMGAGIRPGFYHQPVVANDVAPTLAVLLDIEAPSGSVGRPLLEALAH